LSSISGACGGMNIRGKVKVKEPKTVSDVIVPDALRRFTWLLCPAGCLERDGIHFETFLFFR
jgi:hypothetical protein